MINEWCPFATRRDGPEWKVGYSHVGESGPKIGVVPHSAEGYLGGAFSVLDGERSASWHFTIGYGGTIFQHYPATAYCWHAGDVDDDGGVAANVDLIGIEFIGVAGEPLTNSQRVKFVRLYRWLMEEHNLGRYERRVTVWEHNEVSDEPTSCPSNRIPHDDIREAIDREEAHMASQEYNELKAEIRGLKDLLLQGAVTLLGRIKAIEDGSTKVTIWPVGEVTLNMIRHRGYHSAGVDHDHG